MIGHCIRDQRGIFEKPNFITKDGSVYLVRCPKCGKENWAPAVASGQCAWCGFNGNAEVADGQVQGGDD